MTVDKIRETVKAPEIHHGLGQIDKETYDLTFEHINAQMQIVAAELNKVPPKYLMSINY